MSLKRTALRLERQMHARRYVQGMWPLCMTCGRPVDSEEWVEGEEGVTTWCKILVKHHGAEELCTFEFGSTNWDDHDLRQFMATAHFFDPNNHGEGEHVNVDTRETP